MVLFCDLKGGGPHMALFRNRQKLTIAPRPHCVFLVEEYAPERIFLIHGPPAIGTGVQFCDFGRFFEKTQGSPVVPKKIGRKSRKIFSRDNRGAYSKSNFGWGGRGAIVDFWDPIFGVPPLSIEIS